jgi:hypothetical protein
MLDQIREAFGNRDLTLLAPLLAEDVTWGEVDTPRGCRNRTEVLDTFAQLMDAGVSGDIVELAQGSSGILCQLSVTWPDGTSGATTIWQVYMLRGDEIAEIRGYDDRESAATAAGLS